MDSCSSSLIFLFHFLDLCIYKYRHTHTHQLGGIEKENQRSERMTVISLFVECVRVWGVWKLHEISLLWRAFFVVKIQDDLNI
jgi:hypothetical protein